MKKVARKSYNISSDRYLSTFHEKCAPLIFRVKKSSMEKMVWIQTVWGSVCKVRTVTKSVALKSDACKSTKMGEVTVLGKAM
jgi:hypothetical protein